MKRKKVDPVLTEIVRNGVIAVTEEMKSNLMRTAYNMIIYEALDFTCGLFTADGRTVSIGMGLPSFIRGMANVETLSIGTAPATELTSATQQRESPKRPKNRAARVCVTCCVLRYLEGEFASTARFGLTSKTEDRYVFVYC